MVRVERSFQDAVMRKFDKVSPPSETNTIRRNTYLYLVHLAPIETHVKVTNKLCRWRKYRGNGSWSVASRNTFIEVGIMTGSKFFRGNSRRRAFVAVLFRDY